jgi:hypothetical protein
MDNQIDIYERKVYTVLDVFSDLGGIFEVFHLFGLLLISPFNKRLLKISIVNQLKNSPQKESRENTRKVGQATKDQSIEEHMREEEATKKKFRFDYTDLWWMSVPGSA